MQFEEFGHMPRWSFSDDFRFCHFQVADLLRTGPLKRVWDRMLFPGPLPLRRPLSALFSSWDRHKN